MQKPVPETTKKVGINIAGNAQLAVMFVLTFASACTNSPETQPNSDATQAAAPAADPSVGYDLRRLRPRAEQSLSAMFDQMHERATGDGKRVVVLFSADWCDTCKHLDLELGNEHPRSMIGDVQVIAIKEDDWRTAARMDEFNELRRRWEPVLDTYPLVVLLDDEGKRVEEMKEARDRLEGQGLTPTLPIWLDESRAREADAS